MEATSSTLPQHAEVVVVGAGLVAADELHRRGIDVVVLEAADRVGGRVMVETTALGSAVDLGGQWIGQGHHRFEALAAELGATPFQMRSPKAPMMADSCLTISSVSPAMLAANAALVGFELASHLPARDKQNSTTLRQWLDVSRPREHAASSRSSSPRPVVPGPTSCR
ncbi:FAD-dependent oxidoreductase [Gordonia sp. NPDC003424]